MRRSPTELALLPGGPAGIWVVVGLAAPLAALAYAGAPFTLASIWVGHYLKDKAPHPQGTPTAGHPRPRAL